MFLFLATGFLFGLQHAFDADHLAAIALLNAHSKSTKESIARGILWGIGHTLTIFIVGIAVLLFGWELPVQWAQFFETIVMMMLIIMSISTLFHLWRMRRERAKSKFKALIHKHPPLGLHAHPRNSLFVGIIHGLAGSAALLILIISTTHSVILGLAYILIFGLGSIIGMAAVSIAFDLRRLRSIIRGNGKI